MSIKNVFKKSSYSISEKELRKLLTDYYGTVMFSSSPMVMFELEKVNKANLEELLKIAKKEKLL